MAIQTNGRAKKPKKSTPNGNLNGHINGHINGHVDKTKTPNELSRPRPKKRQGKGIMSSLINTIGRIISWYLIVTIFFRCPSSLHQVSDESPKVCKPYLQIRSYAAPYLDPYYQAYVSPQVEKVQPYIDTFNTQVYTPVSAFTKDKYAAYGAHRVEQAQTYLSQEWDRTVRPQLANASSRAKGQYNLYLAPHVQQAIDVILPYYERTKESTVEIYHLSILPTYEAVLPYSRKGYEQGRYITTRIIFPYVHAAKDTTSTFLTRTIWPRIRVFYGDNVEPQFVRIRERLGRHRDEKKLEAVISAAESSLSSSITSATSISSTSSVVVEPSTASSDSDKLFSDIWPGNEPEPTADIVETTSSEPSVPEPSFSEEELREKLNNDLRAWQSKFAAAADKGAEDLEARVGEITKSQIESGVNGHGNALVIQLEETVQSTIAKFKKFIKQTVQQLPEDATEEQLESAYEKCVGQTRALGLAVKDKAQAVRNWRSTYDQETDELVKAAVDNTIAVLDNIHSIGYTEVGHRWTWTEGVTYKDWQNYHKLRNTLEEWSAEVEAVGTRHEGLKAAHEESKKLEDNAMAMSQKMVQELVRLKEVARWKIWAEDATDDFSNKKVPSRALKSAKHVLKDAKEAASGLSETIIGSETPATQSVASVVKDKVADASSQASESASSAVSAAESLSSSIKDHVVESASTLSESIVNTASDTGSSATDAAQTLAAEKKSNLDDIKQSVIEHFESPAASEKPKKVFGGAMAQSVGEAKQIIFDDVLDDSDDTPVSAKLQSIVAEAGEKAADLTRAVSEALLKPSSSQGSVESVTSLANEQYEKALSAASSALYGTQQQPFESATSVASEKFASAVTAASFAIYGTPTPTAVIQSIEIQAKSQYDAAVSVASEQFSYANSLASKFISGTPKPAHEAILSDIQKSYSDSVEAASQKLQDVLHYTGSIKSYAAGPTQGTFESISSIAASKLSEGLSLASAQFTSQPTPALNDARRRYYEAIGLAHARYSEFLDSASTAVYGPQQDTFESVASVVSASAVSGASAASESAASLATQVSSSVIGTETPWTESVASQASQNWQDLVSKASSQVYGAPTPWTESVYSQAGDYAAQATSQAAAQFVAVQALVSELVIGKEPDFTESVLSRFSSAYHTGYPAVISSASSYANENYEAASSYVGDGYGAASSYAADAYLSASSVVSSIFTPPAAIETIISQANDQINAAVDRASIQVYGTPKGKVEQASESAASAYSSVQSKASEAIFGTQQAQVAFADAASSAQRSISEAIFGTPTATGSVASVTSGAASAYSELSSIASEKAEHAASAVSAAVSSAIYGPEQGAMESASSRLAAAVEVANSRISELYASASDGAGNAASSVSSAASAATQRVKDEL